METTRPERTTWIPRCSKGFTSLASCFEEPTAPIDVAAAMQRQADLDKQRVEEQARIVCALASMLAQQENALRVACAQPIAGALLSTVAQLEQQVASLQVCVREAQRTLVRLRARAYHAAHRARSAAARRSWAKTTAPTIATTVEQFLLAA